MATGVGHMIGKSILNELFPWSVVYESETLFEFMFFINGLNSSIFVGLSQYVLLRWFIPGEKWPIWIIVTAMGNALGYTVGNIIGGYDVDGTTLRELIPGYAGLIPLYAPTGIVVGIFQAPILWIKMKGKRWWFWPLPCSLAFTFAGIVVHAVHFKFTAISMFLEGTVLGSITGLALVLLLIGTPIPKVKEESA